MPSKMRCEHSLSASRGRFESGILDYLHMTTTDRSPRAVLILMPVA
jgi:hypothetical protein